MRTLVALGLLWIFASASSRAQSLAITHVTVIDVVTGNELRDQTVVVNGTRITDVSRDARIPSGAVRVDGRGKFAIPGLWDMHVHSAHDGRPGYYWPLFVAHGVTGVRNMGDWPDSLRFYRQVRDTLKAPAPRIVWDSPIVDGLASYPHAIVVRSASEGRAVVDSMQRLGFAELKVYGHLSRDVYFAVADEAKRMKLPFAGHVPYRISPVEASRAGQKSIEHLENMVEYCTPGLMDANAVFDSAGVVGAQAPAEVGARMLALSVREYDARTCGDMARELASNHTWVTPTLVANRAYFSMPFVLAPDDVRRRFEPQRVIAAWDSSRARARRGYPQAVIAAMDSLYHHRVRLTGELARAGVQLLAGSDASDIYSLFPGASLHDELALLVDAGLTPLQALQAATINPARYVGAVDSMGTVARGKVADLVLLDADPLADIHHVSRIAAVIVGGRYLGRAALDSLVLRAEAAASALH